MVIGVGEPVQQPSAAALASRSTGNAVVVRPGPHHDQPGSSPKPTTDSSSGTRTPWASSSSSTPRVACTEPVTSAVGRRPGDQHAAHGVRAVLRGGRRTEVNGSGTLRQPGSAQRRTEARESRRLGGQVRSAAHVGDPPMPEREQVRGGSLQHLVVVDAE